jgi:6-phosphogluconolactonase
MAAGLESDWSRVELWWGDERCVAPDDERSNCGMAKEALLDRVTTGQVHRIRGELGRDEGAKLYDEELGSLGRFDLLLLGLGPDGHVASLFPEQPTLGETERRVVGAEAKLEPFVDRITLTLPMLRRARDVVFLVTGESKADAAKRAFANEPSRQTPGSLVRSTHGKTTAVLDPAAAAYL